jgi:hypothetical protein
MKKILYLSFLLISIFSCNKKNFPIKIDCNSITTQGTLWSGINANNVSVNIPYINGDGDSYSAQVINSTVITGLTAVLNSGNFSEGSGSLSLSILGTPSSEGVAVFPIEIDGNSCLISVEIFLPEVGTLYQGGMIAYIYQQGDQGYISGEVHGIIAAEVDQSSSAEWGCVGTLINGANEEFLGSGIQNTQDILLGCNTSGTAAEICSNLVLNGFSDWFLPSISELNKISSILSSQSFYWSSTQYNGTIFPGTPDNNAWACLPPNTSGPRSKDLLYNVRAIRLF